jgi:hypothetical protein
LLHASFSVMPCIRHSWCVPFASQAAQLVLHHGGSAPKLQIVATHAVEDEHAILNVASDRNRLKSDDCQSIEERDRRTTGK